MFLEFTLQEKVMMLIKGWKVFWLIIRTVGCKYKKDNRRGALAWLKFLILHWMPYIEAFQVKLILSDFVFLFFLVLFSFFWRNCVFVVFPLCVDCVLETRHQTCRTMKHLEKTCEFKTILEVKELGQQFMALYYKPQLNSSSIPCY